MVKPPNGPSGQTSSSSASANHVIVRVPQEAPESVEIRDRIERVTYRLTADSPPTPQPVDRADAFPAPVSLVVALDIEQLRMPDLSTVYFHDPHGGLRRQVDPTESARTDRGPVVLEFGGPLKIYVAVDGGATVESANRTIVRFDRDSEVLLGARSFHESPAGTVTTTTDPVDVMSVVSTFGGALKTTSPEVSFPTLRGHPPRVARGDQLTIPDSVAHDCSNVTIRVPRELSWVYTVAPLAYYTAARVRPGEPAVETGSGRIPLRRPGSDGADRHSKTGTSTDAGTTADGIDPAELLQHTLLWDTVVRTVGIYEVDTHERERALAAIDGDLDLRSLYDLPMGERIIAYRDLPELPSLRPQWGRAAHLAGTPAELSTLPYLVNSLALIREPEVVAVNTGRTALSSFFRDGENDSVSSGSSASSDEGTRLRSASNVLADYTLDERYTSANWTCEAAYRRATRDEVHNQPLAIHVVCTDPEMGGETDQVSRIYAERTGISSPVEFHDGVTVSELASLLTEKAEYLHYVGHVTDEGFPCVDGVLDAQDLETVGTRAFFLNACTSIRQGRSLVELGSVGGIVTTVDVPNTAATKLGATVARLLNTGFSLESAVAVIGETSVVGSQYRVLGAGEHALTYAESGTPVAVTVTDHDPDAGEVSIQIDQYSGSKSGIGSLFTPHLPGVKPSVNYLPRTVTADTSAFEELLATQELPVFDDGRIRWSTDLTMDDLLSEPVSSDHYRD